jgi:hypothetical protein
VFKEECDELLVVDNQSGDKTVEVIKKYPKITFIPAQKNLGFGKANNLASKAADGEYLFFLNPDTKLEPGAIDGLVRYLDDNKAVAVVGPKLLYSDRSIQKEIANFPTLLSQILILIRFHRISFFKQFVYPDLDYEKTQEVDHLMGAALMVRRSVFEEVGGFDPNFFLWFEETDLLKRIKERGYKVVYYPQASVKHLIGQSTKQLNPFKKQTIWNRSLIYYFKKHTNFVTILILLPFIALSYPAALVSYFLKR